MTTDRSRILGGQHAVAVKLEDGSGRGDRLGRGIKRPAQMLARVAPADRNAMVGEQFVVERLHNIGLRLQRRRTLAPADRRVAARSGPAARAGPAPRARS